MDATPAFHVLTRGGICRRSLKLSSHINKPPYQACAHSHLDLWRQKSEHHNQMADYRRPRESLCLREHVFERQWAGLTDGLIYSSDKPPAIIVKQTEDNLVMSLTDGSEWPSITAHHSRHQQPIKPKNTQQIRADKRAMGPQLLVSWEFTESHDRRNGHAPHCVMQQCVLPGLFHILFTHSTGTTAIVYTPADSKQSEQLCYPPADNSCAFSAVLSSYAAPYSIYNI